MRTIQQYDTPSDTYTQMCYLGEEDERMLVIWYEWERVEGDDDCWRTRKYSLPLDRACLRRLLGINESDVLPLEFRLKLQEARQKTKPQWAFTGGPLG